MATTTGDIISERKRFEHHFSARQTKLAELMLRYLRAREEKNRALDEVRYLYHSIRERGDGVTAKLKNEYRLAVLKLSGIGLESSRSHTDLLEALHRISLQYRYKVEGQRSKVEDPPKVEGSTTNQTTFEF